MELSVVIEKKEKLESNIIRLLAEFTNESGLKITDVEFFTPAPYTGGYTNQPLYSVDVKVEI